MILLNSKDLLGSDIPSQATQPTLRVFKTSGVPDLYYALIAKVIGIHPAFVTGAFDVSTGHDQRYFKVGIPHQKALRVHCSQRDNFYFIYFDEAHCADIRPGDGQILSMLKSLAQDLVRVAKSLSPTDDVSVAASLTEFSEYLKKQYPSYFGRYCVGMLEPVVETLIRARAERNSQPEGCFLTTENDQGLAFIIQY